MRKSLNLSFPDDIYYFIRDRVDSAAFASASEYVRALIRADMERAGGPPKRKKPRFPPPRRANDVIDGYTPARDEY